MAGFFLTAVPNWTGARLVRGWPLVALAATWLAGRIAMHLDGVLPPPVAAAVDLAFLPALAAGVAPALALWLADAAMQVKFLGGPQIAARGARVAIDILAPIITVIGDRIVPAFAMTQLKLRGEPRLPQSPAGLDKAAILSMVPLLFSEAVVGTGEITAAIALVAALSLWRGFATWRQPILAVLHLGYAWLVVGPVLKGASGFLEWLPETTALHGLTLGAVGTMMTAVMSRAVLGHTGRKMEAHKLTVAAHALI